MEDFKKRAFQNAMLKKREEQKQIKEWADNGGADTIIELIKIKNTNRIKPEDLPF
jgi:hypothetical protein